MRNNRRWANGRRLYSWERRGSGRTNKLEPGSANTISGIIGLGVVLFLAWLFVTPIFWIMTAFLVFIACCMIVAGVAALVVRGEKARHRTQRAKKIAQPEKAIGQSARACVPDQASSNVKEANMTYDKRFALIDRQGDARYAAIISGSFQVGKASDQLPTCIEDFARAILIEGNGGRFVCADGRKPAVLKFGGRAKEACAYRLDPAIARRLGISPQGTR